MHVPTPWVNKICMFNVRICTIQFYIFSVSVTIPSEKEVTIHYSYFLIKRWLSCRAALSKGVNLCNFSTVHNMKV